MTGDVEGVGRAEVRLERVRRLVADLSHTLPAGEGDDLLGEIELALGGLLLFTALDLEPGRPH
jgi:hypothetical protein